MTRSAAYSLEWRGLFWDGAALIHGTRQALVGPDNSFAMSGLAELPYWLVITGVPGLTGDPDPENGQLLRRRKKGRRTAAPLLTIRTAMT